VCGLECVDHHGLGLREPRQNLLIVRGLQLQPRQLQDARAASSLAAYCLLVKETLIFFMALAYRFVSLAHKPGGQVIQFLDQSPSIFF